MSATFSNSHRSNPSRHHTNNVGRVYQEFGPSFNFYIGYATDIIIIKEIKGDVKNQP